jgi:alpha-N-arabinofuranosidase
MFKVHQGATSLPVELQTPDYARGDQKIPAVSASASRTAAGQVNLSLVNTDPNRPAQVTCKLVGFAARQVAGRVLTAGAVNAINTFDAPTTVQPRPFAGAALTADGLTVTLPAKSVVVLALQ